MMHQSLVLFWFPFLTYCMKVLFITNLLIYKQKLEGSYLCTYVLNLVYENIGPE